MSDYPEDWQAQGWCCRECAVMSWHAMSPETRSLFVTAEPEHEAEPEA